MTLISADLMDILVCPSDKGELKELEDESKLQCTQCRRKYSVRDGIPVMLIDEAELPAEGSAKSGDQ